MKLYEVPRMRWVRILPSKEEPTPYVPPAAKALTTGDVIFFDHLDGMYSFCRDTSGDIVHLAGWTEVEVLNELEAEKYANWKNSGD